VSYPEKEIKEEVRCPRPVNWQALPDEATGEWPVQVAWGVEYRAEDGRGEGKGESQSQAVQTIISGILAA
jgi:hypothetical protein